MLALLFIKYWNFYDRKCVAMLAYLRRAAEGSTIAPCIKQLLLFFTYFLPFFPDKLSTDPKFAHLSCRPFSLLSYYLVSISNLDHLRHQKC
jgi:hypothetical protein